LNRPTTKAAIEAIVAVITGPRKAAFEREMAARHAKMRESF
jgi:hypothetical protein